MIKRWAWAAAAVPLMALIGLAAAQAPAPSAARPAAPAAAGGVEATIADRFEQHLKSRPTSVTRSVIPGLYEVAVGSDLFYTDAEATYVLVGNLFNAATRENLTQARKDEIMRIDFKSLPLDKAVKLTAGDGTRVFVSFEDPHCTFCRRLHQDLQAMTNYTLYVFLMPVLSPDSLEKSKAIWCAPDRAAAWNDFILRQKAPPPAPPTCQHPSQDVLELGQKIGVAGTPTLFFTDGVRIGGYAPVATIEARIATAARAAAR